LIALQAAREGIVLLKNSDNVLPLDRTKIHTISVIGPNAHPAVTGAGGSSLVQPFRSVSFLDGIIAAAGEKVKVLYSPGVWNDVESVFRSSEFMTPSQTGEPLRGLKGEYFANRDLSGSPVLTRTDRRLRFDWGDSAPASGMPSDDFSIRWTGKIRVESDGDYQFFVQGDDGFRLFVNGEKVIDEWRDQAAILKDARASLKKGSVVDVKLEYYEHSGGAQLSFGWSKVVPPKDAEALKIAALGDVAIVCVGFNSTTEGEGFDRPFALSKEQEELVQEVARLNRKTIVVVTAGGNVAMTGWLNDVAGLLHTWYPGQEGGTALAEILFGDVNPSGKLPASFEKRWEDNATFNSYYAVDKKINFKEGVFVGYRHFDAKNIEPQFAFGFGLSYTSFSYKNPTFTPTSGVEDPKVKVEFEIENTGQREGAEVAQLYVRELNPGVARPVKELKGFEKVWLKPGETKKISVSLDKNAFAYFDVDKRNWVVKPGKFEVSVGSSSRLVRFSKQITLAK
jgi:beta-glucosidase